MKNGGQGKTLWDFDSGSENGVVTLNQTTCMAGMLMGKMGA